MVFLSKSRILSVLVAISIFLGAFPLYSVNFSGARNKSVKRLIVSSVAVAIVAVFGVILCIAKKGGQDDGGDSEKSESIQEIKNKFSPEEQEEIERFANRTAFSWFLPYWVPFL